MFFNKTDPQRLLDIVVTADKFEVIGAIKHCKTLMLQSPLTLEIALLYLEFTSEKVELNEILGPVHTACADFVANTYKDLLSHEEAVLQLRLSAMISIFKSSALILPNEDYAFTFLLKWLEKEYSDKEERKDVFQRIVVSLIRFTHLSEEALLDFTSCNLVSSPVDAINIVSNAMHFKATSSRRIAYWRYEQRDYLVRPVSLSYLMPAPHPEVVAYMDISLGRCSRMTSPGKTNAYSEAFAFGGLTLNMVATCLTLILILPIHLVCFYVPKPSSQPS
ncbi:hypothetical protein VPH35_022344 [Triticum aestivum]|nr:BTB/POZ domain-containing protein At2g46260-like [Triticum aestivum]